MNDFEPIDVRFLLNNSEVKAGTQQMKADIIGVDSTAQKSAKNVSATVKKVYDNSTKEVGEYTAAVNQSSAALAAQTKTIARMKPQWNGLGNSINQISRELPAFAVSAQVGILALSNNIPILADEIGRLRVKNAALAADGQKTVPVWKQIAKGVFGWGTALSLAVTLMTIYGREIGAFFKTIFKGKNSIDALKESQEALNESYKSNDYTKVIQSITELRVNVDLAKQGLIESDDVVRQYNKSLGDATGEVQNLADVEQTLIDKGDAYIEMMLYKTAATSAAAKAATLLADQQSKIDSAEELLEKARAKRTALLTAKGELSKDFYSKEAERKIRNAQDEVNQLEAELKKLSTESQNTVKNLLKNAAEIAKKNKISLFGKDDIKGGQSLINARQRLLDRIAAIDKEFARKSFSKDEEEIQALKDKFAMIRMLVERFNSDPKNKAVRISLDGLNSTEGRALSDLTYRQDTARLAKELRQQKQLFDEFEAYKLSFGEKAAKERFDNDLKGFERFSDLLKAKIKENDSAKEALLSGTATGGQQERILMLETAANRELKIDRNKLNELLAQLVSYHEKVKLIEEKYARDADLIKSNLSGQELEDRLAQLEESKNDELDQLHDANVRKMKSYKDLYNGIEQLSKSAAKAIINNAKEMLAALLDSGEASEEAINEIQKKILETEKALDDRTERRILKLASSLGSLGESLSNFGSSINNSFLQKSGGLLSGLSSGLDGLMTVFNQGSSNIDKVAAGIGGVTDMINMLSSAAAQRKAAEEAYYRSIIGFQHDYNLGLQEQLRLQSILDENVFIRNYEGRITDGLKALAEADEKYQEALEKLGEGRAIIGQRDKIDWGNVGKGVSSGATVGAAIGSFIPVIGNAIGAVIGGLIGGIVGLFGGKKSGPTYGALLEEYPELLFKTKEGIVKVNRVLAESLIENGLVDEATKQILNNILEWDDAIEAAREQIREVITDLTGSLSGDLRNVLVEAFESGEDAAIKMGDTVEGVLENILSNLIFNQVFSESFDKLEEQMMASFDLGGDGTWVDDFGRFFAEANGLTDEFNAALEAAQNEAANFGFDIFNPEETQSESGLQGAIKRELTEATASELTGLFRSQFDITKRHFELDEKRFNLDQQCLDTTLKTMQSNAMIEQNTANTVAELQLAVTELKAINGNTKQNSSGYDRGY